MQLTNKQQQVYDDMIKFMNNKKKRELILVGYAGTGKTTLISKFLNDICSSIDDQKPLCKRVVLAAPTHKAVNIAKSKINIVNNDNDKNNKAKKKIEIMTIHRLLNYQNFIDSTNGSRYFAKSLVDPNWSIYDLIIIDECSMLNEQIIVDINSQLEKTPKVKIIYVGDSAQLPPVNEDNSKIFTKDIDKLYLDEIIRTKSIKIMELSQAHRFWIEKNILPSLADYHCDNIIFYDLKDKNKWLTEFSKYHQDNNITSAIILCWTNKSVNEYNNYIRRNKFGSDKLNKYEIGETIIFNDFYYIKIIVEDDKTGEKKEKKIPFHTSEQVKVVSIEESKYVLDQFGKIKSDILPLDIIKFMNESISKLNENMKTFKIYELGIHKLDSNKVYKIKTIHDSTIKEYDKVTDDAMIKIIDIKTSVFKLINDTKSENIAKCDMIAELEKKINSLWKAWHMIMFEPFAQLNYGYAITVHKSQGSTFDNVFIDMNDILANKKITETKKCLYTAITRCAERINILL